jgi:hypothetical protein
LFLGGVFLEDSHPTSRFVSAYFELLICDSPVVCLWSEGYLLDALSAAEVRVLSEFYFTLGAPRIAEFERVIRCRYSAVSSATCGAA